MFVFGSKTNAFIDIHINKPSKKSLTVAPKNQEDSPKKIPLFIKNDKISGTIDIKLDRKQKLDHMGIRVELIGIIEIDLDQEKNSTFMCNGFDLAPSGTLYSDKTFDFNFDIF